MMIYWSRCYGFDDIEEKGEMMKKLIFVLVVVLFLSIVNVVDYVIDSKGVYVFINFKI